MSLDEYMDNFNENEIKTNDLFDDSSFPSIPINFIPLEFNFDIYSLKYPLINLRCSGALRSAFLGNKSPSNY